MQTIQRLIATVCGCVRFFLENFHSSHWRSMIGGTGITSPGLSKSNGSSSSNQKRGAERLFQYFGADDSDPEDYTR